MARRKRLWAFDDEDRGVLLEGAAGIPALLSVLGRAERRVDLGAWVVEASVSELDEMYDLVGALMDATRSRRRLDVLEGLLFGLSTAIDGF
jgi:hypothetical protein